MLDLSLEPGAGGRAFQPADLGAGFLGAVGPGERLAGALRERPEVAELLGGGLLGCFGHLLAPGVGCGHVPPRPRRAIAGCQAAVPTGIAAGDAEGAALDWPRRRGRTGSAGCPHPTQEPPPGLAATIPPQHANMCSDMVVRCPSSGVRAGAEALAELSARYGLRRVEERLVGWLRRGGVGE